MNDFQYIITMDKINNMKTKKARKELLKELYESVAQTNNWRSITEIKPDVTLNTGINTYRCLSRLVDDRAPMYIKETILNLHNLLLAYVFESDNPIDYASKLYEFTPESQVSPNYIPHIFNMKRSSVAHKAIEIPSILKALFTQFAKEN